MKKHNKKMVFFAMGALLLLALFSGMNCSVSETAYAMENIDEDQSEKLDFYNKSERLILVFENKIESVFSSNKTISRVKSIYGFNGDKFVVIECDPIGCLIYHSASGTFVETSQNSVSPYFGRNGDELFYCGPTQYFQFVSNEFVHTVLGYSLDDGCCDKFGSWCWHCLSFGAAAAVCVPQ